MTYYCQRTVFCPSFFDWRDFMQEKDLKVKQKQSTIKTKDGKNNGKKQKASPLKEKMKADYIRTKTRQSAEKETSEASNQAEEMMEDAAMETGIYVVGRIVSGKKSKKEKQYIFDEDLQSKAEAGEFVWNPEGNKKAVKKKYAVEKGRRIKEKQPARKEAEFPKTVIFQEQQIYNRRSDERKKYQNLKMTKEKIPQKLQKTLQKRSQYQREGKWHAVKSLRETLFFQKTPKTAKQINDGNRFTKAIANTVTAFVKGILAALGGLSGLIIVFVIIGAVLALVSTAFGVFFSAYDDTAGTRRIAEIVAETNSEFYAKVSEIENEVPHDTVEYHVVPDGGDQLFITNWTEVVAVFAAKTAGAGEDAICRKALREESRNIDKIRGRRLKREICFSGMPQYEVDKLFTEDEYFFDSTYFEVMDQTVAIKNDKLAEAIESLAKEKQQIILLSYFFDMTDREIAEVLDSFRSTIQRKKVHSIKELKIKLEVEVNERKKE